MCAEVQILYTVPRRSGVSGRAMSSAWRALLEAHDAFARQHLELSEQHLYQSSEPLRIFRVRKTQLLKRSVGALRCRLPLAAYLMRSLRL